MSLGEPWQVEEGSGSIDNEAFRFHWETTYDPQANQVRLSYTYHSKSDHVAPAHARQVLEDVDRVLEELGFEITHVAGARRGTSPFAQGVGFLLDGFLQLLELLFG